MSSQIIERQMTDEELDAAQAGLRSMLVSRADRCAKEGYAPKICDGIAAITTLRAQLAAETARADRAEAERAAQIEVDAGQPIKTAPMDGTRILAYWPPVLGEENDGWVTTWFSTNAGGQSGWETPWEYADGETGPTHWKPLPAKPGIAQPHSRTALDAAIRAAKVEAWKEAADLCQSDGWGYKDDILALIGEGV